MPYRKIISFFKFKRNSDSSWDYQEDEIWVADFGTPELEDELRQEMNSLSRFKPKEPKYTSWIFSAIILFLVVLLTELLIRQIAVQIYWPEVNILWATWLWRLLALIIWIFIARIKLAFDFERIFIISIVSFVTAVVILALIKIIYITSAWTWLNLLVEPIWMVLLIALVGSIFVKFGSK